MVVVLSAGLLWTLLCLSALLLNRVLPRVDVHVRWPHMVTVYVDTEALNRCAGVHDFAWLQAGCPAIERTHSGAVCDGTGRCMRCRAAV